MVVGPHEEQHLHPVSVVAGDLSDLDLVQRHRDGAHVVLGQHQLEQPGKLLGVQRCVLQDLRELIHDSAEKLPQLSVFRRQLQLSPLLQGSPACLQLARQVQPVQKPPEHPQLAGGTLLLPEALGQLRKGRLDPAAQGVDLSEDRLLLRREPLPPAIGVGGPFLLPYPLGAVDVPGDDIVLQKVTLLVGKTP